MGKTTLATQSRSSGFPDNQSLMYLRAQIACHEYQRKTIVNSWECCLENNQMVISSSFPTVNCRK